MSFLLSLKVPVEPADVDLGVIYSLQATAPTFLYILKVVLFLFFSVFFFSFFFFVQQKKTLFCQIYKLLQRKLTN